MDDEAANARAVAGWISVWPVGLAAALLAAGCSAPAEGDDPAASAATIVGGQETPACAWPTTVHFRASLGGGASAGCTATLIHPKMISIAAHCVEEGGSMEIAFGDDDDHDSLSPRRVPIERCVPRPVGVEGGEDFAYCILKQEVNDVPIIPVLFGCETSILKAGLDVVLVGYGNISENTPSPGGHKRWVRTSVRRVRTKSIDIGDATHGNCFGDSGGPAFVQLPDGTWRVFGATSTTSSPPCASYGTWSLIHPYVAWVEQQSGLDITPCYDSDGTWNPGPKCTGVPLNPEVSGGTWARMCTENLALSGALEACGGLSDAGRPDARADARTDARAEGGDGSARADGSRDATGIDVGSGGADVAGTSTGGGRGGFGGTSGGAGGTKGGAGATSVSTSTPATSDALGSCSCRLRDERANADSPGWGGRVLALGMAGLLVARRRTRRALS